jgi:CTP:molybdopterin cytidylyltransferase MocA
LVLAAGQSRRFGGGKLHALYRGRPLLSHVLDAVATARGSGFLDGGYCVIGKDDDRALTLSEQAGIVPIVNEAPDLGLSHSVQLGLAALERLAPEQAGAAVVLLGDQPLVRVEVIEALIDAWKQGSGPIVRPSYAARPMIPGHPTLLDRSIWPRARQLQGDRGFGSLLESSQHETSTIQVSGDNPDVDTQADLSALEESSR